MFQCFYRLDNANPAELFARRVAVHVFDLAHAGVQHAGEFGIRQVQRAFVKKTAQDGKRSTHGGELTLNLSNVSVRVDLGFQSGVAVLSLAAP